VNTVVPLPPTRLSPLGESTSAVQQEPKQQAQVPKPPAEKVPAKTERQQFSLWRNKAAQSATSAEASSSASARAESRDRSKKATGSYHAIFKSNSNNNASSGNGSGEGEAERDAAGEAQKRGGSRSTALIGASLKRGSSSNSRPGTPEASAEVRAKSPLVSRSPLSHSQSAKSPPQLRPTVETSSSAAEAAATESAAAQEESSASSTVFDNESEAAERERAMTPPRSAAAATGTGLTRSPASLGSPASSRASAISPIRHSGAAATSMPGSPASVTGYSVASASTAAMVQQQLIATTFRNMLVQGSIFYKYQHSPSLSLMRVGGQQKHIRFVFVDPSLLAVRWHKVGHRSRRSSFSSLLGGGSNNAAEVGLETIPVKSLLQVLRGRRTAAFKRAKGKEGGDEGCFSLISEDRTLDLELVWPSSSSSSYAPAVGIAEGADDAPGDDDAQSVSSEARNSAAAARSGSHDDSYALSSIGDAASVGSQRNEGGSLSELAAARDRWVSAFRWLIKVAGSHKEEEEELATVDEEAAQGLQQVAVPDNGAEVAET
jgi:hypothetical protein